MTRTPIGVSPTEASWTAAPTGIGLTNPATSFRKIFPYVGTALVVVMAGAGYGTIRGMATSSDWLGHTYEVKSELANLELNRGLLHEPANVGASGSEAAARVRSAAEAMRQSLSRLKELTRDNNLQQERVRQLEPLLEQHIVQIESVQPQTAAAGDRAKLGSTSPDQGTAQQDAAISRLIGDIDKEESQLLGTRQATWDREFQRNIAVLAFALAACLLLLFTNMHLLREDVRSTRVAAEHIQESADSYRALSARIIGLQDAERRRIGRELHDSVGQSLSAVQMNLEQLASARANATVLIRESQDLVQRTAQEVRTISSLLHPPLLDVVGFVAAAKNYTQQFARRSAIEVKMNFAEDLKLPSKEAELMLFRVLQEALTNVHRHAQATTVDVWLARQHHEVVLSIQDNGRGLPPGAIESFEGGMASGVGLAGMRERLAEFGGRLHVESSPSGTIVRASIPV
jgi:signal transduction histidine kinase